LDTTNSQGFLSGGIFLNNNGGYFLAGSTDSKAAFMKVDSLGEVELNFGNQGLSVYTPNFPGPGAGFSKIIVQPDNHIIAMGGEFTSLQYSNILIAKYKPNGFLDAGNFGSTGAISTDYNGSFDDAYDITLTKDSGLVVVGNTGFPLGNTAVLKYLNEITVGLLKFDNQENFLLLFPNPIENLATLNFDLAKNENLTILLLNQSGKQKKIWFFERAFPRGKNLLELDFHNIPSGWYRLVLRSEEGLFGISVLKK
jgi:hypothetical protein